MSARGFYHGYDRFLFYYAPYKVVVPEASTLETVFKKHFPNDLKML